MADETPEEADEPRSTSDEEDGRRLPRRTIIAGGLSVPVAGCLSKVDDLNPATADEEGEAGPLYSPTGDRIQPTSATRELQRKGYADPYHDVEPTGNVHEVELFISGGTIAPVEGEEMLGFGFTRDPDEPASIPGPEIRVRQGDLLRVHLHSDHHTIHWHGMDVPWTMDGVPFLTQDLDFSGDGETGTYTYEFVARQAGTYWYHCAVGFPWHKDFGMFGALVVEEQDPVLPYDRDETLIFHEVDSQYLATLETKFGNPPSEERMKENPLDAADAARRMARSETDFAGHTVEDETGVDTWAEGPRPYYPIDSLRYRPEYDTFMINGKSYPETEPVRIREGETLRLRLVNAGQQTRAVHLHGHHMLLTHRDGYPLSSPEWRDVVTMTGGQHADVYVQGTNPGIWNLHDHAGNSSVGSYETNDYAFPGGARTKLVYEGFEPPSPLPKPETGEAGDYNVYAPSYRDR